MPDAIECEHLPTQVGYDDELQSGRDPDEDDEQQMSFPETVSDSLCRNSLVMQTDCCSSCLGGWSQTMLEVKMLDVKVLGWCGYTWSAVGCTAKFSETPLETDYVCSNIFTHTVPYFITLTSIYYERIILNIKLHILRYISIICVSVSCVRPVGCTAKFSETSLETAYAREMNIQFLGNSSGGHCCSQHADCTLPQNL